MRIEVKLFAVLKENIGDTVELDVPEPVTVSSLLETFIAAYPQFESAKASLNVAVDHEYSQEDQSIAPGQEIAIFPPVSGG